MLGHKLDPILGIDAVTRLSEKKVLQEIQKSFEEYIVDIDLLIYYGMFYQQILLLGNDTENK